MWTVGTTAEGAPPGSFEDSFVSSEFSRDELNLEDYSASMRMQNQGAEHTSGYGVPETAMALGKTESYEASQTDTMAAFVHSGGPDSDSTARTHTNGSHGNKTPLRSVKLEPHDIGGPDCESVPCEDCTTPTAIDFSDTERETELRTNEAAAAAELREVIDEYDIIPNTTSGDESAPSTAAHHDTTADHLEAPPYHHADTAPAHSSDHISPHHSADPGTHEEEHEREVKVGVRHEGGNSLCCKLVWGSVGLLGLLLMIFVIVLVARKFKEHGTPLSIEPASADVGIIASASQGVQTTTCRRQQPEMTWTHHYPR